LSSLSCSGASSISTQKTSDGDIRHHLKQAVEFGREHHVSFRLQLTRHERLLPVQLALREVDKHLVGQEDAHVGLQPMGLGLALLHGARLLEVDRPACLISRVILDPELEYAVVLYIWFRLVKTTSMGTHLFKLRRPLHIAVLFKGLRDCAYDLRAL
jgi:hypothetical protein